MADEQNTNQIPNQPLTVPNGGTEQTAPSAPEPITSAPVAQTSPAFLDKVKMDLYTLWNEHRLFLIVFGALILLAKFRDIIIDILVNSGNRKMESAHKEDSALATQENQANQKANELVQQANQASTQEPPVNSDWYKK